MTAAWSSRPNRPSRLGPRPWIAARSVGACRAALEDVRDRAVGEDHVGRNAFCLRAFEPPAPQHLGRRRAIAGLLLAAGLRRAPGGGPRLDAELGEERAGLSRPCHRERPLRPRDADVEQPPFLVPLLIGAREARGELLVVETRQEHSLELEALGPVIGEEMDAARAVPARVEPRAQLRRRTRRTSALRRRARPPAGRGGRGRPGGSARAHRACPAACRAALPPPRASARGRPQPSCHRRRGSEEAAGPHRARAGTSPGTAVRPRAAPLRSRRDASSFGRAGPPPRAGHRCRRGVSPPRRSTRSPIRP